MAEDLTFRLLANADNAVSGFIKAGRSAAAASDDVLGLAKRLDEVGSKTAKARVELSGNKEAQDQLDKLDLKLLMTGRRVVDPKISVDGALKAATEIKALEGQLDALTASAAEATAATGAESGGLSGVSGMGALIGAGVVLSPVIATLATGMAGFALAAYGAAAPIEKAAQATGGLAANMHTLNPEQQILAKSILGLGKQYDQFQQALQPETLSVFAQGIRLAGDLMRQVEPVAKATGVAIGGLLAAVDREFTGGNWTSFFQYMSTTAGPDLKLLGAAFVNVADTLPPLLRQLQPVATGLLDVTVAGTKVVDVATHLAAVADGAVKPTNGWQVALHELGLTVGVEVAPELTAAAVAASHFTTHAAAATVKSKSLAGVFGEVTGAFSAAAVKASELSTQITSITTAEQNSLNTQTAYAGDLVTTADDAHTLEQALKKSQDRIGLHTAAQRASFGYANTYITDLGNTASAAYKSGHGVDASIKAISNGLPILEQAKTKNRAYWTEVSTLVGWLHKLQNIHMINQSIHVSATGQWSIAPNKELPGGTAGGPSAAARGMLITGGRAGVDDQLIRAQRGELVVPTAIVGSGAVDHLRGSIPGFASGGVVGSYRSANPGLLGAWTGREDSATLRAFENAVARAVKTGIAAARSGGFGGGLGRAGLRGLESLWMGAGGPGGGTAHVAAAIAEAESGGNPMAHNASGASGLWQILGQVVAGNIFNPHINALNAVKKYDDARGFSPWVTFETGAYKQFLGGGGVIREPVAGVGRSGRMYMLGERGPETVTPGVHTGGDAVAVLRRVEALLQDIARTNRSGPAVTGQAMARGLQGTARRAGAAGMYSARGAWA